MMDAVSDVADLDRTRYTRLFTVLAPHLDEKTKRLVGAAMAYSVGRGGQRMVQDITGLSSHTLKLGHDQLMGLESLPDDRIRRVGGGRKPITAIIRKSKLPSCAWWMKALREIQNPRCCGRPRPVSYRPAHSGHSPKKSAGDPRSLSHPGGRSAVACATASKHPAGTAGCSTPFRTLRQWRPGARARRSPGP